MGDRDSWTSRDLPVLKAAVDIFEDDDEDNIEPGDIARRTGLNRGDVQRAVRALYKHPYLDQHSGGMMNANGDIMYVGEPTGDGFRAAENWPSPEGIVGRLVAALEQAAEDETRPQEERSRLKMAALTIGGAAYQVALGVLGNAGGNFLSS
jgi:hypothetical protein